jgi:hypothetical protein
MWARRGQLDFWFPGLWNSTSTFCQCLTVKASFLIVSVLIFWQLSLILIPFLSTRSYLKVKQESCESFHFMFRLVRRTFQNLRDFSAVKKKVRLRFYLRFWTHSIWDSLIIFRPSYCWQFRKKLYRYLLIFCSILQLEFDPPNHELKIFQLQWCLNFYPYALMLFYHLWGRSQLQKVILLTEWGQGSVGWVQFSFCSYLRSVHFEQYFVFLKSLQHRVLLHHVCLEPPN